MPTDFRPRVARPAGPVWNVAKTLLQTAVMWGVFLFALPYAVYEAETLAGLDGWRFTGPQLQMLSGFVFAVLGVFGLCLGPMLAILGEGTPLPLDTARRFVVAGPYKYVRNPMAMGSLGQAYAVGLYLGSPAVLAYATLGVLVWNYVARPWEEADLAKRFGDRYELYHRRVRCWRVRLRPYEPLWESMEPPISAARTTPPVQPTALYDGRCPFCRGSAERLARLTPPGALELVDFQKPGALVRFPGVEHEACMTGLHLVMPDGRVLAGAEAVLTAVAIRPALRPLLWLYRLPGLRLVADVAYDTIARNRYRIYGGPDPCPGGACGTHVGKLPGLSEDDESSDD